MKYLAAAIAVVLWSGTANAADGAACATGLTARRGWEVSCVLVCDSKTSSDSSCSSYTIREPSDAYTIAIDEDEDCSAAAELDVSHASTSTGDTHELAELIRGGATAVTIDGSAAHPLPVLSFALSNMTGCTDFDVKLLMYNQKRD